MNFGRSGAIIVESYFRDDKRKITVNKLSFLEFKVTVTSTLLDENYWKLLLFWDVIEMKRQCMMQTAVYSFTAKFAEKFLGSGHTAGKCFWNDVNSNFKITLCWILTTRQPPINTKKQYRLWVPILIILDLLAGVVGVRGRASHSFGWGEAGLVLLLSPLMESQMPVETLPQLALRT